MSLHRILISTGSNIDKEKHTNRGFDDMNGAFQNMQVSTVYESISVGFKGDTFFNAAVLAYTNLEVDEVCKQLKIIERNNGRVKSTEKFCPRTLDLDLLTYDDLVCSHPIVLPREEIMYNAFVLRPLAELIPQGVHPIAKKTYLQLWEEYDKAKQVLWPSDFRWRPGQR